VKSAESAVIREEKRDVTTVSRWPFLVLTVKFIDRERSSPDRFAKILFGSGFLRVGFCLSGGFENHGSAVVQTDFGCLPCLACFFAKASMRDRKEAAIHPGKGSHPSPQQTSWRSNDPGTKKPGVLPGLGGSGGGWACVAHAALWV
jgi:hypothetical protein